MIVWEALKALFRRDRDDEVIGDYPNLSDAEAIRREFEAQQRSHLTLRQRAALRRYAE